MMGRRERRQPRAFTLIELMLAMAMVSMLALSLYSSLRTAFRARQSAIDAMGPVRAAQAALDMVGRDLECALPPTGVLAGAFIGEPLSDGVASRDTLEFYSVGEGPYRPDDPTRRGGMRCVVLEVAASDSGTSGVLLRHLTTNLLAPVEPEPIDEVLCRGVRSFSLRYYDGEAWQTSWDSTTQDNALPVAVEATLEIAWPADNPRPDSTYKAMRLFPLSCYSEPAEEPVAGGAS